MLENLWYEVSSIWHTWHSLAFVKIYIEGGDREHYKAGKNGGTLLYSSMERCLEIIFRGKDCT